MKHLISLGLAICVALVPISSVFAGQQQENIPTIAYTAGILTNQTTGEQFPLPVEVQTQSFRK